MTVKVETRPAGTDGDNLIKTKLVTGTMDDVFLYNSGSLFQALEPDKQLAPLTDQPWVKNLTKDFKRSSARRRASTARRRGPPSPAASCTTRRSTRSSG